MFFDVNAEMRPSRQVQPLLDRWAFLHFHSAPAKGGREPCGCGSKPCACLGAAKSGIKLNQVLHRLESTPDPISRWSGIKIAQHVGEEAGAFRARCVLLSARSAWPPSNSEHEPEVIDFDQLQRRWLAIEDCVFDFGYGWEFRGLASGEICPVHFQGRNRLMAFAAGSLRGASGKAAGLHGSFTLNGQFAGSRGFIGSISCSIHDPQSVILKDREIPEMRCMADPFPEQSYLVLRAVKSSRRHSEFASEAGDRIRIRAEAELKAADFHSIADGSAGLRSSVAYGRPIGSLDMETVLPVDPKSEGEASGRYEFKFTDGEGAGLGSLTAELTSGCAFPVRFSGGELQFAAGMCGAGLICAGTGHFAGAQGVLSTHSVLTLSPHAISDVHVLGLIDPGGKMRAGVPEYLGGRQAAIPRLQTDVAPVEARGSCHS